MEQLICTPALAPVDLDSYPSPASALPWGDLFMHGIELIQLSRLSVQQKVQLGQDIYQQLLDKYRLESNPRTPVLCSVL